MLTKSQVNTVTEAKKASLEGRLSLWNLRLDALSAQGAGPAVLDAITDTLEDTINNCGCNVQCGALQEQGNLATIARSR
ncbi:MAG: hypothetical protein AAFN94_07750 [Pseudomonadota bacterium]